MTKRLSINGKASRHHHPIPNASRIGGLIMSSIISGVDPASGELPEALEEQVANVFAHIKHDVEAAGASVDDILKISVWVKDPASQRQALNAHWLALFPDAEHRPARETHSLPPESRSKILANFTAYVA